MMTTPELIPFNKPAFLGEEPHYIAEAVHANGYGHLSGDGPATKKCSAVLAEYLNVKTPLLTHSCTGALEMTALLMDLQEGDEVICPSYTFVTSASAFALSGAKLVFVDIRPDTMNLDEEKIEAAITDKTKAIVAVHYAGVSCEMDRILEIANKHNIYVVEDAAQAIGSTYKGRKCGTMGHMACFSFHETKNIVCGEGGALIVNEASLYEKAEIIREKGTNRSKFFRGQVDKYTWVDLGSSFLLSDLNAAYLYPQLKSIDKINGRRRELWQHYWDTFQDTLPIKGVRLPETPPECAHNAHMFYLRFPDQQKRAEFISHMKEQNIWTVFHYIPLHSAPAGRKHGRVSGQMTNTDTVSETLVRLPLYYNMTDEEQNRVIDKTLAFISNMKHKTVAA